MAYDSEAGNLVPGDTNGVRDVFVHDRKIGTTTRVSLGPGGAQASLPTFGQVISADRRLVAFSSRAHNLVPGDTNSATDVLVHDRKTGTTTQASLGPQDVQANGDSYALVISADGRLIAFDSYAGNLVPGDTNGVGDVFVYTR